MADTVSMTQTAPGYGDSTGFDWKDPSYWSNTSTGAGNGDPTQSFDNNSGSGNPYAGNPIDVTGGNNGTMTQTAPNYGSDPSFGSDGGMGTNDPSNTGLNQGGSFSSDGSFSDGPIVADGGTETTGQNGGGGFLDGVTNALTGGSGSGGLGDLYAPMMFGQALKQWNDADQYMSGANQAADRSDPFGMQARQGYRDKLQGLYDDPSSIENTPGYKFSLQQGLGSLDRQEAAGGYLGAGKASKDEMDYASGLASQTWNTEANRLSQLSGSQFNPSSAGQMMMQGQANKIGSQNAALASMGAGLAGMYGPKNAATQAPIQITNNNNSTGGQNSATGTGGNGGGANGQGFNATQGQNSANQQLTNGVINRLTQPIQGVNGVGAGSNLDPSVASYLTSQGIDPNSLTPEELNMLDPTGSYNPGANMDQSGNPALNGLDTNPDNSGLGSLYTDPTQLYLTGGGSDYGNYFTDGGFGP